MEQNYLSRAAKYLADLRKRKAWRKVVSGMGAVVVFCTVYALILPALTWARPVTCGQEEHVHDESCYASLPQESAGPAQMAAQTPAEPQCSVESIYEVAAPGQEHADFVLHTHGDECFLDGGIVICTLPTGFPLHVHDESCYTEQPVLVCGQEGAPEGSVPSPDPVVPAPEPVIHHHSDTCYTKTLICGQEEVPASEGHRHSDACYEITTETIPGELICGITDDPAHIHGEECYAAPQTVEQRKLICLLPESDPIPGHQHMDACWEQTLTCGKEEGQPEPIVDIMDEPVPAALGQETAAGGDASVPPAPAVHVHSESCYQMQKVLTCDKEQYTEHLHVPACYDENGELTCGRLVTVSHVHTAECFPQPEQPGPVQPEEPERVLACGKEEHTHTDLCYAPEEPALPDNTQQKEQWDAIFWSNYVDGASDVVLDAQVSGTWSDTAAMDTERLTQLYAAPAEDLSRYLSQEIGIQVDAQLYHSELHGPMDADAGFSILLKWSHDEASFSTMTYTYQFPEQVVVADVERRILSDAAGPALAYSVAGNLLTVTYYAPAAAVEASFLLKAAWAPELGESTHIQWTPSTFTDVTFAKPELTVAKTMGEDGLRVMEDGTVWADYTVTVTNSGKVQAKEITFTDTLESQYFHFARGAFENGADYSLTVNTSAPEALSTEDGTPVAPGAEQFLTFENYDGGNVLTFPAFDLAAGESRVFQYKASMSSEDRERVDEAVEAARETASAPVDAFAPMALSAETAPGMEDPTAPSGLGETVRNTASVSCPALGEAAVTASSVGTYGGPERKHVEDLNTTYHGETFDVTFVVNGDARLPAGASLEKIDGRNGSGFSLEVQPLPETDPDHIAFSQALESQEEGEPGGGEEEQLELKALRLELRYNGVRLDLDDCDVTATVTPNETLKNYRAPKAQPIPEGGEEAEEVLGDKGFGIELKAFTLEEQTDAIMGTTTEEIVEGGSIYIDVPEEDAQKSGSTNTSAPVTVAFNSNLQDGGDPLTLISVPQMMAAEEEAQTVGDEEQTIEEITFTVRNGKMAVDVEVNPYPKYTVQFYAELDRPVETGSSDNQVRIIDTSDKSLPQNGTGRGNDKDKEPTSPNGNPLMSLYFKNGGGIQTSKQLLQIFTDRDRIYNPKVSLSWQMLDNIGYEVTEAGADPTEDRHYELKEVWILKEGKDARSTEKADWDTYDSAAFAMKKFTNDPQTAAEDQNYILIKDSETVFRMVYQQNEGQHTNEVNFYDYDISTTERPVFNAWNNGQGAGINSPENYSGTGEAKYAFGNNNTGTPYGGLDNFGGEKKNQLNKFNGGGKTSPLPWESYHGCTFGLVGNTYGNDGKIQYMANSPKLFNDGTAIGKYPYDEGEYTLQFIRQGDTYTISAVNGAGLKGLENLSKGKNQYTLDIPMWTNHFWPMDTASTVTGAEASKHDIMFGKDAKTHHYNNEGVTNDKYLDTSDNGQDHNSYFGMQASFEFTLPDGYVGPLDYYFFGDDDLWLYLVKLDDNGNMLSSQLVCDLGGVKSSTSGEYVNLGEWIGTVEENKDNPDDPNNQYAGAYRSGNYRLDLYYTERGASGSTCWMQFTIPNIRSGALDKTPDGEKGSLRLKKEVSGVVNPEQEYQFNLKIDGANDIFSVKKYDKNLVATTINKGDNGLYEFTLKAGESMAAFDLPKNATYVITELEDPNNPYTTTIKTSTSQELMEGRVITGTVQEDVTHYITYTNTFHYQLPETGGLGTTLYTLAALPTLLAAGLLYKRSRKKGGTVS